MVYVDGTCYGGYYEQDCSNGYWETGLCYDGTFVPGYCNAGYYEWRFPGGVWVWTSNITAPTECSEARPSQMAIAASAAMVLHAKARDDLEPSWQAALDRLLESGKLENPDEATFDAIEQILNEAM